MIYKVWDELNGGEEHASDIVAFDAGTAAEIYADDDVDGGLDGIYSAHGGHPVSVRDPDGTLHRFVITVDYEPTYYAERVE